MTTTMSSSGTERSLAEKLTLGAMVAFALAAIEMQAVEFGALLPPVGILQAVVALIVVGPLLWRWRWGPLLAPIVSLGLIAFSFPYIILDLSNPAQLHSFVWTLVAVALLGTTAVAGAVATVQQRRTMRVRRS